MNATLTNAEYLAAVTAIPDHPGSVKWDTKRERIAKGLREDLTHVRTVVVTLGGAVRKTREITLYTAQERVCAECGSFFTIPVGKGRPAHKCRTCRTTKVTKVAK